MAAGTANVRDIARRMGRVIEAIDVELDRTVAVKRISRSRRTR